MNGGGLSRALADKVLHISVLVQCNGFQGWQEQLSHFTCPLNVVLLSFLQEKNINYFPLVYCLSKNNKIKLCNVAFQALTYLLECSFFGTRLGCCAGAHVGERNLPDVIFSWVSSQQSRSPSAYFLKDAILTISQPQLISPKAKTKQNTQALTLSWQEL